MVKKNCQENNHVTILFKVNEYIWKKCNFKKWTRNVFWICFCNKIPPEIREYPGWLIEVQSHYFEKYIFKNVRKFRWNENSTKRNILSVYLLANFFFQFIYTFSSSLLCKIYYVLNIFNVGYFYLWFLSHREVF